VGTTTEPPWVHKSSGIAGRNGTNTHVITFSTDGDAPFTPANGNLLVVVVYGAVTHTVSTGGWTEQQQPVVSGELSAFTVTAASHTSITVVHNGSNYPVTFFVGELPAGSTITASSGASPSSDIMAPLTGLPGTAQLIIAAVGRVPNNSNSNGVSPLTWTAPFVKDAEQFAVIGATDGAWMTVAHAINITSTSVTPVYSPTYLILPGDWSIADREHVIMAINAVAPAGGATPFTRDYTLNWRVFNAFTKDTTLNWRVLAGFTRDYTLNWRVLAAFTRDYTLNWRVLNGLTRDYSLAWRVFAAFTADTAITWRVFEAFQRDYTISWDVLSGTSFQRDYTLSWRVFNSLSRDYSFAWRVFATFTRDYAITWRVFGAFTRDYTWVWRVYGGISHDYTLVWAVLGDTPGGGLVVAVWSGTVEVPIISMGVWDGTTEHPAIVSSIV
jgi:hypothetical protein